MTVAETLKKVRDFRKQENFRGALEALKPILNDQDIQVQWALAQVCWDTCNRNGIRPEQAAECERKLSAYLERNPKCGSTYKALALLLTMDTRAALSRQGVEQLERLHTYISSAIKYLPEDGFSHYLMGMYCFEMAHASMQFKRLVEMIRGRPVTNTIEEAFSHFVRAEPLMVEDSSGLLLMMAQCYLKLGKQKEATDYLEKCQKKEAEAKPKFKLNSRFAKTVAAVGDLKNFKPIK